MRFSCPPFSNHFRESFKLFVPIASYFRDELQIYLERIIYVLLRSSWRSAILTFLLLHSSYISRKKKNSMQRQPEETWYGITLLPVQTKSDATTIIKFSCVTSLPV